VGNSFSFAPTPNKNPTSFQKWGFHVLLAITHLAGQGVIRQQMADSHLHFTPMGKEVNTPGGFEHGVQDKGPAI